MRIPGVDSAIDFLRPGATYTLRNNTIFDWVCPNGTNPPTWEEIEEQIQKDIDVYNYYQYSRNREMEYGDWKKQLDLLYQDIKSGNLEDGNWIKMIDSVKQKYPKPE